MIWVPIHILWLYMGISLRRLDLPARTQRTINIAMSVALILVVGLALGTLMLDGTTEGLR